MNRLHPDFIETDPHYFTKRDHGRVMINRLVRLYEAGFRVDPKRMHLGLELPLVHPNKRVPKMCIWDDGLLNDMSPLSETPDHLRNLFEPEDEEGFGRFLARIPKPTLLERLSVTPVGEVVELVIAAIMLIVIFWGLTRVLEGAWDWLKALLI